jgi:hypothetical protein
VPWAFEEKRGPREVNYEEKGATKIKITTICEKGPIAFEILTLFLILSIKRQFDCHILN